MHKLDETAATRAAAMEDNASAISDALCYLTDEAERLGMLELAGLIRRAAQQAVIESSRTG